MPRRRSNKGRLPRAAQLALGTELRARYGVWGGRLPWQLLSLAQRVSLADLAPADREPDAAPAAFDSSVLDPATIAILDEAFDRAWTDLQSVKHEATKEALARCLAGLIQHERDPARLATKAVIELIAPAENRRLTS